MEEFHPHLFPTEKTGDWEACFRHSPVPSCIRAWFQDRNCHGCPFIMFSIHIAAIDSLHPLQASPCSAATMWLRHPEMVAPSSLFRNHLPILSSLNREYGLNWNHAIFNASTYWIFNLQIIDCMDCNGFEQQGECVCQTSEVILCEKRWQIAGAFNYTII